MVGVTADMPAKRVNSDFRKHLTSLKRRADDPYYQHTFDSPNLHHAQQLLDDDAFWKRSSVEPILVNAYLGIYDGKWHLSHQYVFQNYVYWGDGKNTPEEEKLLVQDAFDSERRKFERLRTKFSEANHTEPRSERPGIPEETRIAVWRRDGGNCVRCGSRERLEYDHIIPISRGGSNTARNIELLCENCNRSKGDRIQ